jgi:hypothetical protein
MIVYIPAPGQESPAVSPMLRAGCCRAPNRRTLTCSCGAPASKVCRRKWKSRPAQFAAIRCEACEMQHVFCASAGKAQRSLMSPGEEIEFPMSAVDNQPPVLLTRRENPAFRRQSVTAPTPPPACVVLGGGVNGGNAGRNETQLNRISHRRVLVLRPRLSSLNH